MWWKRRADDRPHQAHPDKFTLAVRQRRMFAAQQRVDEYPGFSKLERRWCDPPEADESDRRRDTLAAERTPQAWSDADSLAAALREASTVAEEAPLRAFFLAEPEARWVEARPVDLLGAVATALPGLRLGVVLLGGGDCALWIDVRNDADRATFETGLGGDWPPAFRDALTP